MSTKPSPLAYRELIAPSRRYGPKLLTPDDIPIHSFVYNSPEVYTPEFTRAVLGKMVESMREDAKVAAEMGVETWLEIGDDYVATREHQAVLPYPTGRKAVTIRGSRINFSDFKFTPDPEKRATGLYLGSSNIDIIPHIESKVRLETTDRNERHPMKRERLEEYAFACDLDLQKLKVHSWWIHNIFDPRSEFLHFIRSFAILFNNLGLEQI